MSNGINNISPNIRDFLLNRNLILSDTITNNGLSSLASGLGQPAIISSSPEAVSASIDIEVNGDLYRDLNLITNPYGSTHGDERIDIQSIPLIGNLPLNTPQVEYPDIIASEYSNSTFNISSNIGREQILRNQYQPNDGDQEIINIQYNPSSYSPREGGYIDNHNNLNVGGPSTTAIDFIGGLLNGNSIGLDGQPNFDIRSSLAGRVLGATGVINDTPLGIIGGQQLLIALGNKAAFNAQRETIGQLNLSPVSLLSGNNIIVPNYSITVAQGKLGKVLDVGLNILGFESPTSYLFDRSSSIFISENPIDTRDRAENQIQNTGKGQIITLFENLKANKYRMTLSDNRLKDEGIEGNLYVLGRGDGSVIDNTSATSDIKGVISASNVELGAMVRNAGFESLKGIILPEQIDGDGTSEFIWSDERLNVVPENGGYAFNSESLLGKTQKLFNTNRMEVLVSGHGAQANGISEVETTISVGGTRFISKGSAVLSQSAIDGTGSSVVPSSVFCRTWTTLDKYNQVSDLQKHSGLEGRFGLRNRNTTELSVLDDNGFVRIAPNIGDDSLKGGSDTPVNIKRFMFSLENLAWSGSDYANLPASERGPGDPVTGTKGRIMWFPPYGLTFTDTTSVNWDSHSFIGRGEPLYTYNNSERSGTLNFKVIIDHASYMNDLRGNSNDNLFASIAAGCYEYDLDKIKNLTKNEQDVIDCDNVVTPEVVPDAKQVPPAPFTIYFANDVASLNTPVGYEENGNETNPPVGCVTTTSQGYTSKEGQTYPDAFDYGLNKEYVSPDFIAKLKLQLKNECPACRIKIGGYASTDGTSTGNAKLVKARAENVQKWFVDNVLFPDDPILTKRFSQVKGVGVTGCPKDSSPVDALCKKKARRADITFEYDPELNNLNIQAQAKQRDVQIQKDLNNNIKSRFYNESLYFQKLEQENKVVFDSLGEKIKYFHPAFHSITPEGFNGRLNFLEQCTRQGPTNQGLGPNNLVFGMAPVLILRIGDFYHTKIIIESLDIDFDSGTGVQWDLNPEGVGVQPMIANVNMSFKFIGGQSLNGPINKLQNAVSFNFFANTEVYDPRADYIKINTDPTKGAEYRNDVDKGNLFAILNTNVDGTINEKPEANQIAVAETANSQQTNENENVSGSTDNKPTIIGFELIETKGWEDSNTSYSVEFVLKAVNIGNQNDDNIKKIADKGVKIRLTNASTNALILEEVLKFNPNGDGTNKYLNDALRLRYFMGTTSNIGTRINDLTVGNYNLTVIYNGQTLQTQPISIGKIGGFIKYY